MSRSWSEFETLSCGGHDLPLARDLMNEGIRINTILPGIFGTPVMHRVPRPAKEALGASVPFPKSLGYPDAFAQLAIAIIQCSYFNGEDIRLDGAIRMAPR